MTLQGTPTTVQHNRGRWRAFASWERTAIAATVITSILLTAFFSRLLGVPRFPDFSPSLVVQSPAFFSLAVVLLMMILCAIAGSVFAGQAHHDAGLFAAGVALATLSVRGGSLGTILRSAPSSLVFGALLFELMILSGFFFGISMVLERLSAGHVLGGAATADVQDLPLEMQHPTLRDKLSALLVQTLITLVVVALLSHLDSKKQILLSMFVATFAGSVAAHHLFPIRGGVWFWSGPLIAGFIAYIAALFISNQDLLKLGLPPLSIANPTPLDYAGLGVCGALFGYWASRRWHKERAALAATLDAGATG